MPIESEVYGTQAGVDASRRPPLPQGARARILEHSSDRLVLLVPAGPSRISRTYGVGLLAMNGSFVGGMALWTSLVIGRAQNGFILAVLAAFIIFLMAFSAVLLVSWLRFRFRETWILIEPNSIAVKRTLFGRSVLKTLDVEPNTVATFVRNWSANDGWTPADFNICIRCGRKKLVFGTVLSLGEKQWILDEINSIVRGDIPQLQSVVLAENQFEFVPNEVAPEVAKRNIRVDRSNADTLVFEATAKPRTTLGQAAWMLELVLSALASVLLLTNIFTRWWLGGTSLLAICLISALPLFIAVAMAWGSAMVLFVRTKVTIDREHLTRSRTPALFSRAKSIPTRSIAEVVVRTRQDPRDLRDGKLSWRLRNRNARCLIRSASESLELSLLHEPQDILQIAGLVRFQLHRFART